MTQAGLALPGLAGRRTIDQVMPSVAAALGSRGFANTLELPEAPRYVVLLVDGLGQTLLEAHAAEAPFLASLGGVSDVVCGVPSTTATSLTSLGTGVSAGSHGMVGYTSRDPETGLRLNALRWDLPIDPVVWQPRPTVLELLQADGIEASSVNDAKFVDTGLTLCSQRGVPFHGVNSVWERLDVIVEVIEAAPRSVTYAYESRLDHTGHAYGCGSEKWREMLTTVDQEIADLRAELPNDCVLIVTADHGMIDLPMENRFDVNQHPALLNDVTMLAGEARFRHLYTRNGSADDVAARWAEKLGDRAVVRTQDGIEDWFGPIAPEVRGRIGDVVVASLGDFAVFSTADFVIEMKMTGFHGSITEPELRIPVLVAQ
ncbi:hypothetical protein J2X11_001901 [Aeromicrobium panaciterrae]|uniref:Alkaline phosphatase family protein n=1 Tax=Aeromicrobium panaciterrae TaxID=363861 RepID=A0ABU1UPF0_9ACTN|nr:alkaline phosphatase family protein [Aeromicrobium panaciterrae]MDR7087062.1 hypothetical protein [Aeromicrobium panaciterrae]